MKVKADKNEFILRHRHYNDLKKFLTDTITLEGVTYKLTDFYVSTDKIGRRQTRSYFVQIGDRKVYNNKLFEVISNLNISDHITKKLSDLPVINALPQWQEIFSLQDRYAKKVIPLAHEPAFYEFAKRILREEPKTLHFRSQSRIDLIGDTRTVSFDPFRVQQVQEQTIEDDRKETIYDDATDLILFNFMKKVFGQEYISDRVDYFVNYRTAQKFYDDEDGEYCENTMLKTINEVAENNQKDHFC